MNSGKKAKSNPQFKTGFEGLNLFQQRYARGGNQFTVEPPDQALCVGNGYVVEAVNDVLNVYNTAGQSVLPDNTSTNIVAGFPTDVDHAVDLNSFYGYAPAINRSTGVRAQFVTDPSCLYDAATGRFFVTVLTLETFPNGAYTHVNHIDIAVSNTSNPTGTWTIYRVDVTNDGTNTGGINPGPYLGDYPHIGADANGFYVTTNAYPWCCNGFSGAQVYAFSKAQLAAGAASVTVVHFDTSGTVNAPSDAGSTQPGFTVWPAQSPGAGSFNLNNGGTEYFLSSNAADEATHPVAGTGGNYTSNQLVVWTLTNTSSLNSATPALSLTNKIVGVGTVRDPAEAEAARVGYAADDERTAGLLHQRHHDRDHRRDRLLAAPLRCPARPRRGHLPARLERHPDAAGHVRQRPAVGGARHGPQPGRRPAACRDRLVHRQPELGQGHHAGLPRGDRV